MSAQRLTRTGVALIGAGAVLVAGMITVALTLPVRGIATWFVWVAVVAVALGPLWIGVIFTRSNEQQVGARIARPSFISVLLAFLAGTFVWDRYLTHPETPFTVSTVAYCVIAVLSVLLTIVAPLTLGVRITPEELRTTPVDGHALPRWGRAAAAVGGVSGAGLAVTTLRGPASLPSSPLLTVLSLVVAACAVVAGVLLTRVVDLRTGYRVHLVVSGLQLIVLVAAVLVAPFTYVLMMSSVVGVILFEVLFFGALFAFLTCTSKLTALLEQHGVLRSSAQMVR